MDLVLVRLSGGMSLTSMPACGLHALMDRSAVDAGVDQQMHDMDILRSELPRHLGQRAQTELRR
jgi:hypothetical protein